jgi:hypothetical protein
MIQLTVSLLAGLYVKIGSIEGIERLELTFHWNMGVVPPFDGVAEKVTAVLGQNGLVCVEMETPAGRLVLTVIVMMFDKAGLPVKQDADEFRRQETWSPLAGG